MDRQSKSIALWATMGFVAAVGLYVVTRCGIDRGVVVAPPRVERRAPIEDEPSEPIEPPAKTQTEPAVTHPSASTTPPTTQGSAPNEASLMATLRELRGSNPMLSLTLAREGNARFGDSPDAAERTWFVVKSLSDLGRHDEAREEARLMVEKFRGTSWAHNVYRHMLVHPPDHPMERGHGKELELEE